MLAVARLLRPLVDTLGDSGTVMSGANISMKVAEDPRFKEGVVYSPRRRNDFDEYYLDLAHDVQILGERPEGRHPDGMYS